MHEWNCSVIETRAKMGEIDLRRFCACVSSALVSTRVKSCLFHSSLHHSKTNCTHSCNVLKPFQGKPNKWYIYDNVYPMTLFDLLVQMEDEALVQLYGDVQSKYYSNNAVIVNCLDRFRQQIQFLWFKLLWTQDQEGWWVKKKKTVHVFFWLSIT